MIRELWNNEPLKTRHKVGSESLLALAVDTAGPTGVDMDTQVCRGHTEHKSYSECSLEGIHLSGH